MITDALSLTFHKIYGAFPARIQDNATQRKIRSFSELKEGWHFGEGVGPSSKTLRDAIDFHKSILANGFAKTGAFPGIDGEIRLTIYDYEDGNNEYHEFTFEADGMLTYVHEVNGVEDEEIRNLDFYGARQILVNLKLSQLEWSLLESSPDRPTWTLNTSPQNFKIWRSSELAEPYPYLLNNVPSNVAIPFVPISGNFTSDKLKNPLASSVFPNQPYQQARALSKRRVPQATNAMAGFTT